MPNWGNAKVVHEKVGIEPEQFIKDAEKYIDYGDYKLAESLYAKAYKIAKGTAKEPSIESLVKQGLLEIKKLRQTTSPEAFIKKADLAAEVENYGCAERVYIAALTTAKNSSNVKNITAVVRTKLQGMYLKWAIDYVSQYDFQDAEPILLKYLNVADDKNAAKNELLYLYYLWGSWLEQDKNMAGAVVIYVKRLRIEMELGNNTDYTVSRICAAKYISKKKSDEYQADQLYVCSFKHRIRVFLSAIILSATAILLPLFAPMSLIILVFSYAMLQIDERECLLNDARENKYIKKCVILTFFALACVIVVGTIEAGGRNNEFNMAYAISSIVVFAIETIIAIRLMFAAIRHFRVLFSYKTSNPLVIAESFIQTSEKTCKRCGNKIKVSGENIGVIKCSKCNTVIRGALNLKIKNKPEQVVNSSNIKNDLDTAAVRAAGGAMHLIMNDVLRNIRF